MSEAIDILRHEHDAILMALNILEQIAAGTGDERASPADISGFLGFLREFADTCHHGKEEGLLFPAMLDAGLPREGGPIAVMLADHAHGRELVAAMSGAVEPELNAQAFAAAATAYVDHMRAHIAKENTVLFPMADQVVPVEVMARLAPAFERHEEEVIGHGRHEELHDMLKQLKARYPGS